MADIKKTDTAARTGTQSEGESGRFRVDLLLVGISKHLLDEHLTLVWGNDSFYDLLGCPQSEFETGFHNRLDEYFHRDSENFQELMRSIAEARDKGEKGVSFCLKLLSLEGTPFWVKLQTVFQEEATDGFPVAYTTIVDATEMMLAQEEREKAEERIEKLGHEQDMLMCALQVSVSLHLLDEHFTCLQANEYYYQLIGYSRERYEALFHNHCDEYYQNNPEGWQMVVEKVTEALERGENQYEVFVPMKYEDGSSYWVRLFGYFTDEYINGYRSAYTVMTDVTNLIQMKNEQEMLMQAMKVSVSRHLVDEHFTVLWTNEFFYQLIGYSKQEYEAQFHNHCDEYFQNNQESWNKITEKLQTMFSTGEKRFELFISLKIPDGSTCWVKMTGFFTDEYHDGKQLGYITMVNVTDMMQIQQEKAIAYDNIPGFIVKHRVLQDKIIMIDASERISDVFDVQFGKLSSFDIYSALTPESRAEIMANHPRFRRGEPYDGTICMRDRYDRERWFQIHCTCIDAIADDPVYLTVFIDITDITELQELQHKLEERTEMLNAALEEAKKANAAKSDFLSRMSHDIRTPMNAIFGMTTIAAAHVFEPERIMDCLTKITVSSKLLLSLINEVLDMSKIESGRIILAEEEVDLSRLVQGVVTMVQPQISAKNLRFRAYVGSLVHETVISDMQRLQQLLLNLMSNAVKYTSENGSILLEINEKPAGRTGRACYEFIVSDDGIGMKSDFLERVFDPFERADDERIQTVQGTGLGLAICKSITELMDGTIQVESTYRKGSRFTVTVCLQIQEDVTDDSMLEGLSVLVVDDDEHICRNTCGQLKELGVTAEWVTDGLSALQQVKRAHAEGRDYYAVIIDYRMPGMDGIQTTRLIREAVGDKLPVIMLSAYDLSDQMDAAKKAGANGYITKPLFRSRLQYRLKQFINGGSETEPQVRSVLDCTYTGKRILLAEDNEMNREIAVEILSGTGAVVDTAENGKVAVDMIRYAPIGTYDLVFMDMQMPVMDGCTAAVQIRALPREDAGTLPIIAMTANAFADDRQRTKDAGMNGHLAKPIDMEQLQQVLQKWL